MDARVVASSYAQFLRSFCTLSQVTLSTIIVSSLGAVLISPQALSSTLLELKINEQLSLIQSTGPWLLTASLITIRLAITGNQAISGLGTNTFAYMSPYAMGMASIDINTYEMMSGSICSCYPAIDCQAPAAIYSNPVEAKVDIYHLNVNSTPVKGMQTACYPLEGFLSSTLECYFDSSCLQLLVPNSTVFMPLNATQTSRFLPNTTLEELINDLLVEQWSFGFSSQVYFDQCAPSTCAYSYSHRNTLLTVVTIITSTVGGLNTALRIIIPWLIRFLFKLKRKFLRPSANSAQIVTPSVEPVVEPGKLITFYLIINHPNSIYLVGSSESQGKLMWLWTKIKTLNAFNSQSNNPSVERREQQTTRLYIILLFLVFIIFFFYTTFTKQTKNYVINRPTQAVYENLQVKYADTIDCPCANATIPYENFISIDASYHQICSSEFTSSLFIGPLFGYDKTHVHRADFMAMSGSYFTWIASYCQFCQLVVLNLYISFQTETFVNTKLLPQNVFEKQADDIIESFITTIPHTFVRALTELLELTASLQVLAAPYTSFDLHVTSDGSIRIDPDGFSNCSCLLEPMTCSTEAGFYLYDVSNASFTLLTTVMGIRVTCLSLQSFLQSNLECWYSNDCYQEVRSIRL
jgi:hypothetical protein